MVARQYDVCDNRNPRSTREYTLLLVLQSDYLSSLTTSIVAPMTPVRKPVLIERLNPVVAFKGRDHQVVVQEMASILWRNAGPPKGSLREHHSKFVAAIDLIFTGY